MGAIKANLAVIRDYIERTTHWREGGADRHAALCVALPELERHVGELEASRQQLEDQLCETMAELNDLLIEARGS